MEVVEVLEGRSSLDSSISVLMAIDVFANDWDGGCWSPISEKLLSKRQG